MMMMMIPPRQQHHPMMKQRVGVAIVVANGGATTMRYSEGCGGRSSFRGLDDAAEDGVCVVFSHAKQKMCAMVGGGQF
jgi:hypothetical protein